jgi:hypothetical protein
MRLVVAVCRASGSLRAIAIVLHTVPFHHAIMVSRPIAIEVTIAIQVAVSIDHPIAVDPLGRRP